MKSVINDVVFDFDQVVSIRTDVKLGKDDIRQIVAEADDETLEEIVYQSLVAEDYLRVKAKEVVERLKSNQPWTISKIDYLDDEGNRV